MGHTRETLESLSHTSDQATIEIAGIRRIADRHDSLLAFWLVPIVADAAKQRSGGHIRHDFPPFPVIRVVHHVQAAEDPVDIGDRRRRHGDLGYLLANRERSARSDRLQNVVVGSELVVQRIPRLTVDDDFPALKRSDAKRDESL